jgi:hypothetical protein
MDADYDPYGTQAEMLNQPLQRSMSRREQLAMLGLLSGDEGMQAVGKVSLDLDAKRQNARDARDAAYAEARMREGERAAAAAAQREWQEQQARAQRDWQEQQRRDQREFQGAQNAAMRSVMGGNQPLIGIVGPNGQPVLVPRPEAVGQAPASSAAGGKTPAEIARMNVAFTALDKTVNEYLGQLEKFDPRSPAQLDPTKRATLDALQARITLEAKEAAALGALTGPDLKLVSDMLSSPTGIKGAIYGTEGLTAQTGQMRNWIAARRAAVADQFPPAPPRAPAVLPKSLASRPGAPASAAAPAADPVDQNDRLGIRRGLLGK